MARLRWDMLDTYGHKSESNSVSLTLPAEIDIREIDGAWRFRVYVYGVIILQRMFAEKYAAINNANHWLETHSEQFDATS